MSSNSRLASANATPCLVRLLAAFSSSHSNSSIAAYWNSVVSARWERRSSRGMASSQPEEPHIESAEPAGDRKQQQPAAPTFHGGRIEVRWIGRVVVELYPVALGCLVETDVLVLAGPRHRHVIGDIAD